MIPLPPATPSTTQAAARITQLKERATPARIVVLAALLDSSCALSHVELAAQLPPHFDRVTLYRVLDWLVARGLVHRIATPDVWRFSAVALTPHPHAHFICTGCHRTLCLAHPLPVLTLPADYQVQSWEMTIYGHCPACTCASTIP